jgi:hypothetical protein
MPQLEVFGPLENGERVLSARLSSDRKRVLLLRNRPVAPRGELAALEVVDLASRKPARVTSISRFDAKGEEILGLRFVEEGGWFGDGRAFVAGTVNPSTSELRVVNIEDGAVVQSMMGARFSVCPARPMAAHLEFAPHFGTHRSLAIRVNDAPVPKSSMVAESETLLSSFLWTSSCGAFGYLVEQPTERLTLRVVKAGGGERQIPITGIALPLSRFFADGETFVIVGKDSQLFQVGPSDSRLKPVGRKELIWMKYSKLLERDRQSESPDRRLLDDGDGIHDDPLVRFYSGN